LGDPGNGQTLRMGMGGKPWLRGGDAAGQRGEVRERLGRLAPEHLHQLVGVARVLADVKLGITEGENEANRALKPGDLDERRDLRRHRSLDLGKGHVRKPRFDKGAQFGVRSDLARSARTMRSHMLQQGFIRR